MEMQCKESFLNAVVRVQVYVSDDMNLPVPPTIPNLKNVTERVWPNPILAVAYSADTLSAAEGSIIVKVNPNISGSSIIYIYNVDFVVNASLSVIDTEISLMQRCLCNVVVTLSDGTKKLLYSLPNSWKVETSDNLKDTQVKLTLSSLNNVIDIV